MSLVTLAEEDVARIRSYLSLAPSTILPSSTFAFLEAHLHILPTSLLLPFSSIISPRQRSTIPIIKSRRLLHASNNPLPNTLRADSGRLRWPLLWERLGGSSLPPSSQGVEEEEDWVTEGFMPGKEGRQHVKKLGGFLRGLEEEREQEGVREARRVERRLDDVGEEFDEESDDEEASIAPRPAGNPSRATELDQEDVKKEFERKLLELFVDGLDVRPFQHWKAVMIETQILWDGGVLRR